MIMRNKASADRHKTWVENKVQGFVPSRTGRDMLSFCSFYPSIIPNGINKSNMYENFKKLAI